MTLLNEILGMGKRKPTKIGEAGQREIVNLLDSISHIAERAAEAVAAGNSEEFKKLYIDMDRHMVYIHDMIRGRGPKEFK